MRGKKVIISTYDSVKNPYYGGGGALAIHELAKILSQKFQVLVVASAYIGSKNEFIDGVMYRYIGTSKLGPLAGQLLFHFAINHELRLLSFDCLIESFTPPFSTSFTPLFTNKPVIGLVHMLSGREMAKKYKIPFQIIERLGLNFYKHLIVMTEGMKKTIVKINPVAKVSVIPNSVNSPMLLSRKHTKAFLLYMGRIDITIKGLDLLIDAYVRDNNRDLPPLIIAGKGLKKEEDQLQRLIDRYRLQEQIITYGFAQEKEKTVLYSAAYACVIPSRSETFSLTALESLKMGVPIVSFDIEGLRWIPDDVSVKTTCFNTIELKDNIVNLITNRNKVRQLTSNGYEFSNRYSWQNSSVLYEKVIEEVLKIKAGRII